MATTPETAPATTPETQAQLDHLGGKDVVVEYVWGDGQGDRFLLESLDDESEAVELWSDVAFTNGPPLVAITMRWDPKAAAELRAEFAKKQQGGTE